MIWWPRKAPPLTRVVDPEPDGLPVLSFEQLVERTGTADQLHAIRRRCGFTVEFNEAEITPLLRALAEHVQLLPAIGSEELGSLWTQSLDRASRALMLRQGRILPPGAAPETVGAAAHRWTAVVLLSALLDGVCDALMQREVIAVESRGGFSRWSPFGANLREAGTLAYRAGTVFTKNGEDNAFLGLLLLGRWGSGRFLGWLSEDRELWGLLCERLVGRSEGGVLGELIDCVPRQSAKVPPKVSAASDTSSPVIDSPSIVSPLSVAAPHAAQEEFLEEFEERQRKVRTGRSAGRVPT